MALFGDLEHHALTDLANVLQTQSGTLYFHEAYQGRTLELTLRQGRLRLLHLDGFPVQEQERVRGILRELHSQGRGAFEFQPQDPAPAGVSFYNLPLSELLEAPAEAAIPLDQLPHPDTRFVAVGGGQPAPLSLAGVWALLRPHLEAGASAAELAAQVGRPEAEVRAMLHRLRAVGLVAPQRALAQPPLPQVAAAPVSSAVPSAAASTAPSTVPSTAPSTAAPAAAPASLPLVQRLLGALRRLGGAART